MSGLDFKYRKIDAEALQKRFNDDCATECAICKYYKEENDPNGETIFRCGLVDEAPTIETLHRITGEPYRVCRAKMKANNWDLWAALGFPILDTVRSVADELVESFRPLLNAICETVKSIDLEELRRAAEELKKMQDERLIQCTAEHCPIDPEEGCENCAGYEPIGGWL